MPNYTQDQLRLAVSAVKQNRLTVSKASREFSIPRKTIDDHVKGRVKEGAHPGGQPMFDNDTETALADYFSYMASRGFPFNRVKARSMVKEIARLQGLEAKLRNGPTQKWFKGFFRRHPELSERKATRRSHKRLAQSNESVIDNWFTLLGETIQRLGLTDHPERIYNCDETGFSGKEHPRSRVICAKGQQAFQVQLATEDHVTALMCIGGVGSVMPTHIIFKGGLPHSNCQEHIPKSWLLSASKSGYIDTEQYEHWFMKIFVPNCSKARPVLLICDNHESHMSLNVINKAREEQIEILGLPGHTTQLLQPLDLLIFRSLKSKVTEIASSLNILHSNNIISRAKLPFVLKQAIIQAVPGSLVIKSFQKAGIIPLDKNAIDWSQIQPSNSKKNTSTESQSTSTSQPSNSSSSDQPSSTETSSSQPSSTETSSSQPSSTETSSSQPSSTETSSSQSASSQPSSDQPSSSQSCSCACCAAHGCTSCPFPTPSSLPGIHCPSCFHVLYDRHPIQSVLKLSDEVQEVFHVPATKSVLNREKSSRSRVIPDGRTMTGDEFQQQAEEKKEKKMLMEKQKLERKERLSKKKLELEEKKAERERNKKVRLEGKKVKATRKSGRNKRPKLHFDEDVCQECGLDEPDSEMTSEPDTEISWITCDECDRWFHCVCVHCKPGSKCFVCVECDGESSD